MYISTWRCQLNLLEKIKGISTVKALTANNAPWKQFVLAKEASILLISYTSWNECKNGESMLSDSYNRTSSAEVSGQARVNFGYLKKKKKSFATERSKDAKDNQL